MKYLPLVFLALAACEPETVPADNPVAGQGAAGAVAPAVEALQAGVPAHCATIETYSRTWLDSQTPGSLRCSPSNAADYYWACKTDNPSITYSVQKTAMSYAGSFCSVRRTVSPSQSSSWKYECKFDLLSGAKSCWKR